MANGCSDVQKKTILVRDFRFFAVPLSEMDLDNANTRGMLVFVFEKPCNM